MLMSTFGVTKPVLQKVCDHKSLCNNSHEFNRHYQLCILPNTILDILIHYKHALLYLYCNRSSSTFIQSIQSRLKSTTLKHSSPSSLPCSLPHNNTNTTQQKRYYHFSSILLKENEKKLGSFKISRQDTYSKKSRDRRFNSALYAVSIILAVTGLSYAAVPLYKVFCAATGYGGTTGVADSSVKTEIIENHPIRVRFESEVSDTLQWSFKPVQPYVNVKPGEKVLVSYIATNHADTPLVGVSIYNVAPDSAGQYFNKIQCFCFDEQRLNPGETVYMPVYFYIDPEITNDKYLRGISEVTLSYTFFLASDQTTDWWEEERDKHVRPKSQSL